MKKISYVFKTLGMKCCTKRKEQKAADAAAAIRSYVSGGKQFSEEILQLTVLWRKANQGQKPPRSEVFHSIFLLAPRQHRPSKHTTKDPGCVCVCVWWKTKLCAILRNVPAAMIAIDVLAFIFSGYFFLHEVRTCVFCSVESQTWWTPSLAV